MLCHFILFYFGRHANDMMSFLNFIIAKGLQITCVTFVYAVVMIGFAHFKRYRCEFLQ